MRNACLLFAALAVSGCGVTASQVAQSPSSLPPAPFLRFGTSPVPSPARAVPACTPQILFAEGRDRRPYPTNCPPPADPTDLNQPYGRGLELALLEEELREVEAQLGGGGSGASGAGNLPRGFLKNRKSDLQRAILRLERGIV